MDHTLIKDTLGALLEKLDLPYDKITVVEEEGDGFTRVDIESPQASRLIGWHGETLNSIQSLLKSIIRTKESLERSPFLVLDVDGYRRMQEDKVRQAAERKAELVRRTGNRIALAPMSPYFRRVVHLHIANTSELQDLTTESAGKGDYRQVVLRLKEEKGHGEGELSPVLEEAGEKGEAIAKEGWENLDV